MVTLCDPPFGPVLLIHFVTVNKNSAKGGAEVLMGRPFSKICHFVNIAMQVRMASEASVFNLDQISEKPGGSCGVAEQQKHN